MSEIYLFSLLRLLRSLKILFILMLALLPNPQRHNAAASLCCCWHADGGSLTPTSERGCSSRTLQLSSEAEQPSPQPLMRL